MSSNYRLQPQLRALAVSYLNTFPHVAELSGAELDPTVGPRTISQLPKSGRTKTAIDNLSPEHLSVRAMFFRRTSPKGVQRLFVAERYTPPVLVRVMLNGHAIAPVCGEKYGSAPYPGRKLRGEILKRRDGRPKAMAARVPHSVSTSGVAAAGWRQRSREH